MGPLKYYLRRYSAVIFFPTFAVSTIWADYNHTRKWKLVKAALESKKGGYFR